MTLLLRMAELNNLPPFLHLVSQMNKVNDKVCNRPGAQAGIELYGRGNIRWPTATQCVCNPAAG